MQTDKEPLNTLAPSNALGAKEQLNKSKQLLPQYTLRKANAKRETLAIKIRSKLASGLSPS